MNDWLIEMLPKYPNVESAIASFAMHEKLNHPITLDNGAKVYPKGWLRFIGASRG